MDRINIAIALNRKVLPQAAVLLRSVALNNEEQEVRVYVLYSELTADDLKMLEEALYYCGNNELVGVPIDRNKFDGLPSNQFWSLEMYYRLMLPQKLGGDIDRLLYLDVDMIVNKNLSEFYFMDLGNYDMAVARDMEYDTIMSFEDDHHHERNRLFRGLADDGMVYFCSGMLLMNIKQMRQQYSFDYYMQVFETIRDRIVLPDQDLLNYVHYKNVIFVDEHKYGLFAQTAHAQGMSYSQVKDSAVILHFTGKAKPWTINLIRYDIEKIWWEYAKTLPFYNEMLEQVFYNSMESDFAEKQFQTIIRENDELRQMLAKCNSMIKRLMGD
jgi:lipopolysaccharide biosynthesis glycosyltransferase